MRKAVWAAIKRTLKEIVQCDKYLAEHLRSPTLRGGLNPCYSPPDSFEWET
ncbi:MAG: hypothetical protein H0W36_09860 [Gemmatimonadetes bacterium]|nr:hypothetical protein [Gemmatimonadota bacterium]